MSGGWPRMACRREGGRPLPSVYLTRLSSWIFCEKPLTTPLVLAMATVLPRPMTRRSPYRRASSLALNITAVLRRRGSM